MDRVNISARPKTYKYRQVSTKQKKQQKRDESVLASLNLAMSGYAMMRVMLITTCAAVMAEWFLNELVTYGSRTMAEKSEKVIISVVMNKLQTIQSCQLTQSTKYSRVSVP